MKLSPWAREFFPTNPPYMLSKERLVETGWNTVFTPCFCSVSTSVFFFPQDKTIGLGLLHAVWYLGKQLGVQVFIRNFVFNLEPMAQKKQDQCDLVIQYMYIYMWKGPLCIEWRCLKYRSIIHNYIDTFLHRKNIYKKRMDCSGNVSSFRAIVHGCVGNKGSCWIPNEMTVTREKMPQVRICTNKPKEILHPPPPGRLNEIFA